MSCAISTLSARTVHAASTTSRSITARRSSSSSAIQRSTGSQGSDINSKRCRQNSKLHDARPFSTVPKWKEDGDGAIFGLTISAFLTAGFAAAYLANDSYEDLATAQCSSLGIVNEHDTIATFKQAILGSNLQRTDTKHSNHGLKVGPIELGAIHVGANSSGPGFNTLRHQPNSDALTVVEASVEKASPWKLKAKAIVDEFTKPPRYDVSVRALKGGRLSMEDTFCIHDGGRFAGVFDGHGGSGVSRHTSKNIYDKIIKYRAQFDPSPTSGPSLGSLVKSIGYAFEELDNEVLDADDFQFQGSTAVAIYMHEDKHTSERTIISTNIGDSRAILSRGSVAIDLTRDHKPDDEYEKERILAMGATIEWDEESQVNRVKSLSLSRAIGDRFAKPVVSGETEIKLFPLDKYATENEEDDCIILASDGLWDVFTSQDCADFVKTKLAPSEAQLRNMSRSELLQQKISRRKNMGRFLANEAIRRGSFDNICVIVMWLDEPRGKAITS